MMPRDTSSVSFTLSIWRDFEPPRLLAHDTDDAGLQVFDGDSSLQEQVYSWSVREDAFGGIPDPDTRRDLRALLSPRLADSIPPPKRRLSVLQEFVDASQRAMDNGEVHSSPSQTRVIEDPETGAAEPIEINSLLALTNHFRWIISCFGDQPGISVLVR